MRVSALHGKRSVIHVDEPDYPSALRGIRNPPEHLYVMGCIEALKEGLAVVGARRATPYGLSCARRFALMAAERGLTIISGGARGCDSVAHEAALETGSRTVAFLGGGIDVPYPREHVPLFQRIVDGGGALVSENEWDFKPLPYTFRERNRLIAGLARATLIVEAGLPSGTFSTADAALEAGREVLVVPGAITSASSRGANRLIYQGATPVVDDETFEDALFSLFTSLRRPLEMNGGEGGLSEELSWCVDEGEEKILAALRAEPLGMERLRDIAASCSCDDDPITWLMFKLLKLQKEGLIAQYPDGRYGPYLGARNMVT